KSRRACAHPTKARTPPKHNLGKTFVLRFGFSRGDGIGGRRRRRLEEASERHNPGVLEEAILGEQRANRCGGWNHLLIVAIVHRCRPCEVGTQSVAIDREGC
ncbi:unnamed protein product, partial [Scytosiphon promiscuus]